MGVKTHTVVHENVVYGSSKIGFLLVIADSERDMPGIKPKMVSIESDRFRVKNFTPKSSVPNIYKLNKSVKKTIFPNYGQLCPQTYTIL